MIQPIAKRIPHVHELHGDKRADDYYWLNDKTNPDVIAYLEEENRYFKEVMTPLEGLTEDIYEAMIERVPASEMRVPIQNGPYYYYVRQQKELQYPIYARKKAATHNELETAQEEIILNLNELSTADGYLSVTETRPNMAHAQLAYLENRDGTDLYTAFIKDLSTDELLPDKIENVYIYSSIEWSNCGQYIFYVTANELQRPNQLWRHKIGTTAAEDELLYEETDVTFTLYIAKSQSNEFIIVYSNSTTTTEVRMINANEPLSAIQLFAERQTGIIYDIEHWQNDFIILTNENALNFTLLRCPTDDFNARTQVIEYNEKRYLQQIYPFANKLLIEGREDGLTQVWVYDGENFERLQWDEPIYTLSIVSGQSYDTDEVLVEYESLVTPKTTYSLHLTTLQKTLIQVAPVTGHYNSNDYIQKQIWATATDGTRIPVVAVYKKGALDDGPAPLILTGYGSYGYSSEPRFTPYRLPALEKGVIIATAQVRGGSEMGRGWYEDGKLKHKRNSFTDFIDTANYLIEHGYTTTEQIAARGGSAGGLLVGAVANMAGDRFKVIVAEVPFVDVVTTMLDDTLPLTTLEWDEWGNPQNEDDYFYMKSYSPYDNVEAKHYPHLYITTGLNDPRVGYFEPAKWVARLRTLKTDNNTIVMKTNMGAGHFGASGRFNQLRESAQFYAFVLDKITQK